MAEFALAVVVSAGEAIVSPRGDIDVATAPRLLAEVQQLAAAQPQRVTVDLSDVCFIDSSGLGRW